MKWFKDQIKIIQPDQIFEYWILVPHCSQSTGKAVILNVQAQQVHSYWILFGCPLATD